MFSDMRNDHLTNLPHTFLREPETGRHVWLNGKHFPCADYGGFAKIGPLY